jgi:thiol-disulfide isomerase/thioredoxin
MENKQRISAFAILSLIAFWLGGAVAEIPESRIGADVIGQKLPIESLRWLNTEDAKAPEMSGKVTLLRWWTDGCMYCVGSLPAIDALEKQFGADKLQAVAVYHPKPPRPVSDVAVLDAAKRIKFSGIVAVDDDWAVLRKFYLDAKPRPATSVTFLLDEHGIVRYVHPGPELRPGQGEDEMEIQHEFDEVIAAIESLCHESSDASSRERSSSE